MTSASKPPDRGHLLTEQRLDASHDLDRLDIDEALKLINDQDAQVAAVVRGAIPQVAALVAAVVEALRRGGRLIYVGAGTSGRLGVLDASECPPTFHSDPDQVVGIIAGGDAALRRSSEGAEDDRDAAAAPWQYLAIGRDDVIVGIAAGGTTPFVLGALDLAAQRGATTALICCLDGDDTAPAPRTTADPSGCSPRAVDHLIRLPVGPEVVTGSTRMKAGTATKLVLNMISTVSFVQLGKVWGNQMVDLRATNDKLRDRAARIMLEHCPDLDGSRDAALRLLEKADGRVKRALVMARCGVDGTTAQKLLDEKGGNLREVIGKTGEQRRSYAATQRRRGRRSDP
jgi:N-acetylmuramic acid 6-phosphate etherase